MKRYADTITQSLYNFILEHELCGEEGVKAESRIAPRTVVVSCLKCGESKSYRVTNFGDWD